MHCDSEVVIVVVIVVVVVSVVFVVVVVVAVFVAVVVSAVKQPDDNPVEPEFCIFDPLKVFLSDAKAEALEIRTFVQCL